MKEETQDKRAAALKATLELISEQGFHGTPVSQIAQRANIGMGTLYHYFASKEDLLNALYIDIKTRFSTFALQSYSVDTPAHDAFKQMFRDMVCYFIESSAELSFLEQYENSPLITVSTREESRRIVEPIGLLFKHAVEQNLLKEMPIDMLVVLFSGSVVSLSKYFISGEVKRDANSLNAATEAVWDMIKK